MSLRDGDLIMVKRRNLLPQLESVRIESKPSATKKQNQNMDGRLVTHDFGPLDYPLYSAKVLRYLVAP